jgi:hypothetical protein
MKTLHLGILIISTIGLFFTVNHVFASCATSDVPCNDLISNLPQYNTNQTEWKTFHAVGHYQNTNNPSKSDKLFKVKYQAINGTVDSIENQYNNFVIDVSSINSGLFEIKIPRNYPYTNQPSANSFPQSFMISVNHNQILNYNETTSDCYFEYSIPFSGTSKIEILSVYLLISAPYHGDHIIDKCLPQTTFLVAPLKQLKTGTLATNVLCNEGLQLVVKQEKFPACVNPEHVTRLVQRGWVMYYPSFTLDTSNPNNNLTNHFPNVSNRSINMVVGSTPHTPPFYLPVNVRDQISLEKPSDVVVLQYLSPEWQNMALQDKVFTVQDRNGNDIKASFFYPESLGSLFVGPAKGVQFGNPFHMPIRSSSDMVVISYTMPDIGPINGKYDLTFASFYPVQITLPENSTIISNDTKIYTQFWHVKDDGRVFSSYNTTIPFDDSKIPINSVIEYDVSFKLGNGK